jgi:hypothetical protein
VPGWAQCFLVCVRDLCLLVFVGVALGLGVCHDFVGTCACRAPGLCCAVGPV